MPDDPTTDPTTDPADPTDPADDPTTDPDPAGEPTESTPEQLLEQIRKKDQENVKLKRERKADRKEMERLKGVEDEHKTDQQKAIDEAVKEATSTVEGEWRSRLLAERIMRRATGVLADPSDVVLIDFSAIEDADDDDQIDAAIVALLAVKPHLAATGQTLQRQPAGIFEQGPRGVVTKANPTQGEQAEKWLRGQLGG